jgi:hypothetical protein
MTEKEVDKLSTPEERSATWQWKALQERCRISGSANEGDLMLASQLIGILAARNKRLGLIK